MSALPGNEMPYAEDIKFFWKTSSTAAEVWIEKTKAMIKKAGGRPLQSMIAEDEESGRTIFILRFQFANEFYKITWPVLPSRSNNERAAKIQAATIMHHSVKAKLMEAKVLGVRTAFLSFLALPGGRTPAEMAAPDIINIFRSGVLQLPAGVDVDGEYREV